KVTSIRTKGMHSVDTRAHAGQQSDFAIIHDASDADTPVAITKGAHFDFCVPELTQISGLMRIQKPRIREADVGHGQRSDCFVAQFKRRTNGSRLAYDLQTFKALAFTIITAARPGLSDIGIK